MTGVSIPHKSLYYAFILQKLHFGVFSDYRSRGLSDLTRHKLETDMDWGVDKAEILLNTWREKKTYVISRASESVQ
jgi:hypothetical protein